MPDEAVISSSLACFSCSLLVLRFTLVCVRAAFCGDGADGDGKVGWCLVWGGKGGSLGAGGAGEGRGSSLSWEGKGRQGPPQRRVASWKGKSVLVGTRVRCLENQLCLCGHSLPLYLQERKGEDVVSADVSLT